MTLLPFKLVFEVVLLMLLPLVLLVCISPLCSCASCYAGTGAKISGLFHWEGLGVGVTALFFFYRKRSSAPRYTRHVGYFLLKSPVLSLVLHSFISKIFMTIRKNLSIPAGDCLLGSMAHSCFLR